MTSNLSLYLSETENTPSSARSSGSLPSPSSTASRLSNALSPNRDATLAAKSPRLDLEEGIATAAVYDIFESDATAEGSASVAANPVFESEAEAGSSAEASGHNTATSLRTSLTNDYKMAAAAAQRARLTADSKRGAVSNSRSTRSAGRSRHTVLMVKAAICVVLILAAGLVAVLISPTARHRMLDSPGVG